MSREPVEFVLKDDEGESVAYSVVLHPGSEALTLLWSIAQAGAQPLARLLEGNLGRIIEAMTSEQNVELAELVDELDLRLSDAVKDVFGIIQAAGADRLIREFLSHTYRNGVSLKGTKAFDDAYTANYGEMIEAVVKVVKANRFLALFRISIADLLVGARSKQAEDTINSLAQLERQASTGSSGASGSPASNG